MAVPNSYNDPFWISLASGAESAVGLPDGLLQAVLLRGEKSNANQVSEAGAKTPFQIIPATRDAALKKYGIDAYLSPENAAEVAARLLKDSLDRNKGNTSLAVAEYHGGVNRRNWGPRTKAYVNRVSSAAPIAPPMAEGGGESTFQRVMAQRQATEEAQPSIANIYAAYESGAMDADAAAEFEADVRAGVLMLPRGAKLKEAQGQAQGAGAPVGQSFEETGILPKSVVDAYQSGRMAREDRMELEADVAAGLVRLPPGVALQKTEPMTLLEKIKEPFTGAERETPTTKQSADWTDLPELQNWKWSSWKTSLGSLLAGPEEIAQVVKANNPEVQVSQDEKGNFILTSPTDGKTYAIKPGFRVSDIPKAVAGIAAFTPAGKAASLGGMALGAGATQAAIETSQYATGGTYNPEDIAVATALAPAVPAAVRGVRALRALRPRGAATRATQATEAAAMAERQAVMAEGQGARAAPPITPAGAAAQAVPETVPGASIPGAPAAAEAVEAAGEEIIPEALANINTLARKAAGNSSGSTVARQQLVELAQINAEAKAAAERLGLDLPVDVFADNPQVRAAMGLTRSVVGSDMEAEWMRTLRQTTAKVDDALQKYDASFAEGSAAPGIVSQNVLDNLNATQAKLKSEASAIYEQVQAVIPKKTPAVFPNLQKTLDAIKSDVGVEGLTSAEKRLAKMAAGEIAEEGEEAIQSTYGRLLREKNLIGKALAGKESPYGSVDEADLKRLYGALAEDQLENVALVGGEDLRKQLRAANLLTAQRKGLEKRIIGAYGKEVDGGIAGLMKQAMAGNAINTKAFNKLFKLVPPELREETLMTAIASAGSSKRAAQEGFAFSNYAQLYKGLRANPPVFAQIAKAIGPEKELFLRDLYGLSRRMVDAQSLVLTTGKSNQAMAQGLGPETLVAKILEKPMAQKAVSAVSAVPVARVVTPPLVKLLEGPTPKQQLARIGKVFSSPEFQALITEASTKPEVSKKTILSLLFSTPWKAYAAEIKLPRNISEQERWIITALQASKTSNEKPTERNK